MTEEEKIKRYGYNEGELVKISPTKKKTKIDKSKKTGKKSGK